MTMVSISREVDDSGRWHVVVSVDGQVAEDLDARDEAHSRRIYDDIKLLAQTAGGQVTSEYPGRNN